MNSFLWPRPLQRGPHDAFHFRKRLWNIRHKIQNKGGGHDVFSVIVERQLLRIVHFKRRPLVVNVPLRRGDKSGGLLDADKASGIAVA